MTFRTTSKDNRISIAGDVTLQDFRRVLAAVYSVTRSRTFQDITIDFAGCHYVAVAAMAAIVAEAVRVRSRGVEISIELPTELRLRNLFINAGWAHFLEPTRFDEPHMRSSPHVPLSQFGSATEQGELVNRLVDTLLRSTTHFAREDFAAVEWAINEITDNVLVHSESTVGGFVHLTNIAERRQVELVVADAGVGIPRTLRGTVPGVYTDSDALEQAIRERVTRNPVIGQGNGLYGSYRIAAESGGEFHIHAGYASLQASRGFLKLYPEQIPYAGTLVVASMDYSQADVLANALRFEGRKETPTDHIELKYEMDSAGILRFDLATEAESFGSRGAGEPVRTKIRNLSRLARGMKTLVIDLANVPLVSSSFADEVFGKLFLELGPMEFMRVLRLEGANRTVQELVDRAILQRSSSGLPLS